MGERNQQGAPSGTGHPCSAPSPQAVSASGGSPSREQIEAACHAMSSKFIWDTSSEDHRRFWRERLAEMLPAAAAAGYNFPAEGWQPIKTVPRDGFILVWSPAFPDMVMPFRVDMFMSARHPKTPKHLSSNHYTHWRPMPPAPCDGSPEGSETRSGSTEGNSAVDEASSEVEAPTNSVMIDALTAKVDSLAPHGSCACSYDRPGDVCLHHSPALAAAQAEVERLRELLDARTSALTIAEADRSELRTALSDSESKRVETEAALATAATRLQDIAEGRAFQPHLHAATGLTLIRFASTPSPQETARVED